MVYADSQAAIKATVKPGRQSGIAVDKLDCLYQYIKNFRLDFHSQLEFPLLKLKISYSKSRVFRLLKLQHSAASATQVTKD